MSTTNKKGWSYQNLTAEDIYNYLEYDVRFFEMTEKKALTAVKYYVAFCNKFKDNLIPDTFGGQYISSIMPGPGTNCFLFSFKGEVYLFTKHNAFKMLATEVSQKNSISHHDIELVPSVEKLDWRFQNLTYEEIRKYFNKANLYHNTRKHKFNAESKKRAIEFYLRRCEIAYKHRISEELAIDNIQRIEIADNGYNFKFYLKHSDVFYYFGYSEESGTFEVW